MGRLKDIVLSGNLRPEDRRRPTNSSTDFAERYIADLTDRPKWTRKLKVVAACGNGTAGRLRPARPGPIGCEVVPLDCELDTPSRATIPIPKT
jgi:phosphomannomutase / phosphoglucomutase